MNYKEVIESRYNREAWQHLLHDIFRGKVSFWNRPSEVHVSSRLAKQALNLGKISLSDGESIAVYEVELTATVVAYAICLQRTGVTWAMQGHSCSAIVRTKVYCASRMSVRHGDLTSKGITRRFQQILSVTPIFLAKDVVAVLLLSSSKFFVTANSH